ncbi:hypothetical protein [Streptomyces sp. GbtcB6]|uniref:hypothetical protein n=1 Tax=Streptomyces sp. GbtcB6 TaxID=2824751 RepID=UPI001C31033C|nr:hypothetical protein [Streptomyces sp. GbtcB6]
MKHIWRRITQLLDRSRVAARAVRRNRWKLSKSFAMGIAYQSGVVAVALIYWWWISRH